MSTAVQRSLPSPEDELLTAQAEILAGEGLRAAARLESIVGAINSPVPRYWLAAAYGAAGDIGKQRQLLKSAALDHAARMVAEAGGDVARLQTDGAYAAHIGAQFYQAKLMGPASLCFGLAATRGAASAESLLQYALALQHQGRVDEAIEIFAAATEMFPSSAVHEFLLYACFFAEDGVHRHADEVRKWAALYAPPHNPEALHFANARNPARKLRIGYVAPSFVGTQVRQFLMPSLEAHDTNAFEVFLYAQNAEAEGALRAAKIVSIGSLSDAQACARIKQDRIDVLIDLWGHTVGGRLGVFALKPAPVQVAWINYVQSTGLKAIDYVIHADCMQAPGTAELFAEKIWSLGPIVAPFRPDARAAPTQTPALRNGYVTFGCFNHPAKVNDQTIAAWSRILTAMPSAKLVLKYGYYADPVLQNTMCMRFAAKGVSPAQLEFRGHTNGPAYLAEFGDIDIALDPSPCPGGTTSSEAIASGVPVLVLRGQDFYARIAGVHVEPLGLRELCAETWDDYVARAIDLTRDFGALDALRQRVRTSFENSPARDEAGFTRRLEDAYRSMFTQWCESHV